MKGVSENIMFGQRCPIGTGCFDLLVDKKSVSSFKHYPGQIAENIDSNLFFLIKKTAGAFFEDDVHIGQGIQTPVMINTPAHMTQGRMTPGMSPGPIFTCGFNTPANTPSRDPLNKLVPMQSPNAFGSIHQPNSPYPQYSPNYQGTQSQYSPKTGSPGMSNPNSPYYSPQLVQSPGSMQSPHYGSTVMSPSPTYSSS